MDSYAGRSNLEYLLLNRLSTLITVGAIVGLAGLPARNLVGDHARSAQ